MKKFLKKWKIVFEGLFGLLLVQPLIWEGIKHSTMGQTTSFEFQIGALIFFDLVTIGWFWHCLSPDKSEVKPKWW